MWEVKSLYTAYYVLPVEPWVCIGIWNIQDLSCSCHLTRYALLYRKPKRDRQGLSLRSIAEQNIHTKLLYRHLGPDAKHIVMLLNITILNCISQGRHFSFVRHVACSLEQSLVHWNHLHRWRPFSVFEPNACQRIHMSYHVSSLTTSLSHGWI